MTTADGSRFTLSNPQIGADTLRGRMVGIPQEEGAIAMADVIAIELPGPEATHSFTLAALGGFVMCVFGIMAIVVYTANHSSS